MARKPLAYPVRLAIVFSIVTVVFVFLSFLIRFGEMGRVETGIPFPFHHFDSSPPGPGGMGEPGRNGFLPIGVGLDLGSYLLVSALGLRFGDSIRKRRKSAP